MTDETRLTDQEWRRQTAIDLFNHVWKLIEKENRSVAENDEMVHAAHASRYHWGQVGTAVNLARGEWQISHVYAILNRPEAAAYHAQRCLDICTQNEIGDFDLAYAYEGMARALACAGDLSGADKYRRLARAAGEHVAEQEDRDLFLSDLAAEPWYELK